MCSAALTPRASLRVNTASAEPCTLGKSQQTMHRIVASHLSSFVNEQAIGSDAESVRFEKFVNYAILSQKISTPFDLEHVVSTLRCNGGQDA